MTLCVTGPVMFPSCGNDNGNDSVRFILSPGTLHIFTITLGPSTAVRISPTKVIPQLFHNPTQVAAAVAVECVKRTRWWKAAKKRIPDAKVTKGKRRIAKGKMQKVAGKVKS